jgi:signal transduction histidine kinase
VDITDQRRTEEALARHGEELEALVAARTAALEISHKKLRQADRLATIGTLVAGLGHDMNNVLLPVRCHLDAFGAFDLPEGASEHLQAVRSSLGYLQQLTDGLRLLALDPSDPRASTGSTDLDPWWRQISPLITRAARSEIAVEVDLPPDLPSVPVSPHRLTQAVLNLVVNASEAIVAKGRIRIRACRAEAGRCVELSVSDDGRGMSQEVKRRALDPFYSTKPRGLGTGLGLALVDAMARSAGGSVRIDSEPAQGTTVVLSLPAIEGEVEPTEGPAGRSATITTSDQRLATLVSSLLRAAAFDVRIAEDGGPDGCSLWITDPTAARMNRARRFVSEQAGWVIVLGRPAKSWGAVGAIVVDEPDNFEELREKIGGVVSAIKG